MGINLEENGEAIIVATMLAAVLALAGTVAALRVGILLALETTVIYLAFIALLASGCYLISVPLLRSISLFSVWRVIVPTLIIFSAIILEALTLIKVIGPWMYRQAGVAMTQYHISELGIYSLFGSLVLLIVMFLSLYKNKQEFLQKMKSELDNPMIQNTSLGMEQGD